MTRTTPDDATPRRPGRPAYRAWLLAAAASSAAAGCGADDGLGRRAISGEVTLDGRSLASGSILFDPESERVGTAAGTLVRDGQFALGRARGPAPGRYRVRIYASSSTQAPPPPGVSDRAARPMVELIPARYNNESELVEEVTRDGENRFRFALRSRP